MGRIWLQPAYVLQRCRELGLESWRRLAAQHARLPRYLEFQAQPSQLLLLVSNLGLSWTDRQSVRSFCRLRAGVIRLTHLQGRISRAQIQHCIFCEMRVRIGLPHVLCRCTAMQDWWRLLWELRQNGSPDLLSEEAKGILTCPTLSPLFVLVLRFAQDIDAGARFFWQAAGRLKGFLPQLPH